MRGKRVHGRHRVSTGAQQSSESSVEVERQQVYYVCCEDKLTVSSLPQLWMGTHPIHKLICRSEYLSKTLCPSISSGWLVGFQ